MRDRRAFTLVELLTVVGIVALLAGVLLAVIGGAKRRAYEAQDVSQMRQVYLAVTLYESDHSETSPATLLETLPYAKDERIYHAHGDTSKPRATDGTYTATRFIPCGMTRSRFPISYAYLHDWPPDDADAEVWRSHRADPNIGLLASPWSGTFAEGLPAPGSMCGDRVEDYASPRLEGAILRVRMDGSLFTGTHHDGAIGGSRQDLFFAP